MRNLPFFLFLFIALQVPANAQVKAFHFRGEKLKPGSKQSFLLSVVTPQDSTVIPVTVYHGAKKGFCPVDGVILYKTFNPPVKSGDGLFNIRHIQ